MLISESGAVCAVECHQSVWVSDITYVRLGRDFVYLAVVLDVDSRRIVGWSLGRGLHPRLPLAALNQAISNRQPGPGLVHHSDRGTQSASDDYVRRRRKRVDRWSAGTTWGERLLRESYTHAEKRGVNCQTYTTMEELEQNIEAFRGLYNWERLHSSLGYCSRKSLKRKLRNSLRCSQ